MVVVMEASVCGEASAAASNHRAWYEATGGGHAGGAVSSAPPTGSTSTTAATSAASTDQLDAYFKGSNATTAAYFSQMQAGAYPGMSYHGESFLFHHEKLIQDFLKKEVGDENLLPSTINFF